MDYAGFQVAVIELAARGVPLTVANVVVHLRIDPDRTEHWLDQMARDGRVDVEVDETHGSVVYRVRGLSIQTKPTASLVDLGWRFSRLERTPRLGPTKSVTLAVLLAALFPGFGLAYAAPLRTVVLASLGIMFFGRIFGSNMFLGPLFWVGTIVLSALFGGLYAVRFNQEGHRAPLHR